MRPMPRSSSSLVFVCMIAPSLGQAPIPLAPGTSLPLVSLGTGSGQKGNVTDAAMLCVSLSHPPP